uniref:Uncharacterized protein n=1 Tax=Globisporangium ultimum (strain ATCC 200006 / CBS 805.95 / DAOM BR144) TaxID=431595 RepID=K3WMA3_GLOUD
MFRKSKVTHLEDGNVAKAAAKLQILSIPDKVKLLVDESLEVYPPGLTQPFSKQELARLKTRFATLLPPEEHSLLSMRDFLLMPELRLYPFVPFTTDLVIKKTGPIFSPKQSLKCKQRGTPIRPLRQ